MANDSFINAALNATRRHRADGGADVAPQRELSPLGFYSHGAEAAAALPQAKGSPQQMQAMLDRAGVKPAEFENSGFQAAFAGRPSVTRDEIAQHFKQAMPKVEDRVLKKDETKYSEHTLPGGENYREVLLKHPTDEKTSEPEFIVTGAYPQHFRTREEADQYVRQLNDMHQQMPTLRIDRYPIDVIEQEKRLSTSDKVYRSSHWRDPNVLAHLRLSDRTGPNGEKILHVEEIQSDWGQEGRKHGWKASPEEHALHHAARAQIDAGNEDLKAIGERLVAEAGLPDRANHMMSIRNLPHDARHQAMEEHESRVHKVLQHPEYREALDRHTALLDKLRPSLIKDEGDIVRGPFVTSTPGWTDLALKRVLKEAADGGYHKVIWTPGAEQAKRWNNEEGLKSYYGQMVPKRLQELIKKHDKNAKIGMTDIMLPPVSGEGHNNPPIQAPGFDMTPQMVKSIQRGQALFKDGGLVDAALHVADQHREHGGKLLHKALKAIGRTKHVEDPIEKDTNLGRFLSGSKITNWEGDHKILYHATPKDFSAFKPGGDNPNESGPAIWLSPYHDHLPAGHHVGGPGNWSKGANVMPVYAAIKSPLVLDTPEMYEWARHAYASGSQSFPLLLTPESKQKLIEDGYDGIIHGGHSAIDYGANRIGIGEQPGHDEEIIAFHPHQIKSAIGNQGTFDPSDPDITKSNGGLVDAALNIARQHKVT